MKTIKLTENDIRMAVKNAVTRILRESADEVHSSIMVEKENEIEALVRQYWYLWFRGCWEKCWRGQRIQVYGIK